jgi:hypothetical protein
VARRRRRKGEKQTCPRRMSNWGSWEREEGLDVWRQEKASDTFGGAPDLEVRHCSFCGSLHPDDFMRMITEGYVVVPTDKSYKAYLQEPVTEERLEEYRTGPLRFLGEELAHGRDVGKFYYQHLSPEQQTRFIEMVNAKEIKFGYPGHLYVTPFFAKPRAPEDGT